MAILLIKMDKRDTYSYDVGQANHLPIRVENNSDMNVNIKHDRGYLVIEIFNPEEREKDGQK